MVKLLRVIGLDMQIIHTSKNMVTVITVAAAGLRPEKQLSELLQEALLIWH